LQMLITTIDHNEYVGRIGVGKIKIGSIKKNQQVALIRRDGKIENVRISNLFQYNGLKKEETDEAKLGDIV
ncbi:EF-Tu/IF-2/RF-3 family GTPase, partial [Intestinimonas butyriciproducens]|uniref:EF-Tu/IF-2/RF-3 family GTPase n=1 Tax=Intestinimonas butyriciproducens TaxID=1297617 RepID=UPI001D8184D6|nr:translational GTPase TypA [Intestinimonas butyriciproducens]